MNNAIIFNNLKIIIPVLLFLSPSAWAGTSMERGDEAYEHGAYEQALIEYADAVRDNPRDYLRYYKRGLSKYATGNYKGAIDDFDATIRLNSNFREVYLKKALAQNGYNRLVVQREVYQPITELDNLISKYPDYTNAYKVRAYINLTVDRPIDAITDYTRAIKLSPNDPELYLLRGNAYLASYNYDPAIADYREALRLKPGYRAASEILASIPPENLRWEYEYYTRGMEMMFEHRYSEAAPIWEKLMKEGKSHYNNIALSNYLEARDNLAQQSYAEKNYPEAISQYTLITENTKNADILYRAYILRGKLKQNTGDPAGAADDFSAAFNLTTDIGGMVGAQAYINGIKNGYASAAVELYLSGWDKYAGGDYANAIADFSEVIRLEPGFLEPRFYRGHSLAAIADYAGAIRDYSAIVEKEPKYNGVYYWRGIAYQDAGMYAEAIADYTKAIRQEPMYVSARYQRGLVFYAMGEYAQAIADFDMALRMIPGYLDSYYYRGLSKEKTGDYRGAMGDYGRAIEQNPESGNAWYARAILKKNIFDDGAGAAADMEQAELYGVSVK